MLDEQKILADLNIKDLLEALGIRYNSASRHESGTVDGYNNNLNKIQILCPYHESVLGQKDKSFGSASVIIRRFPNGDLFKGVKCFACGAMHNATHLVMHVKGYTYAEALRFLANLCGNEDAYRIEEEAKEKSFLPRITRDDAILLGLSWANASVAVPCGVRETKNADDITDSNRWLDPAKASCEGFGDNPDDFVWVFPVFRTETLTSIDELFESDFITYREIIMGKAVECLKNFEMEFAELREKPQKKLLQHEIEARIERREKLRAGIERVKEIYMQFLQVDVSGFYRFQKINT